jgi:hypothetical protein
MKNVKKLKAELEYCQSYVPVNGLGKWARSFRVENIASKIGKI